MNKSAPAVLPKSRTARGLAIGAAFLALLASAAQAQVKIAGSPVVNTVMSEAAEILQKEKSLKIDITTEGGGAAGIAALGNGVAQIAMTTHAISGTERSDYPDVAFTEYYLGEQVVAFGVSADVWEHGVHQITRTDARGIYFATTKNWRQLGGPDEKIAFYDPVEEQSAWKIFTAWISTDTSRLPAAHFPTVADDAEALQILSSQPGAITLIDARAVDGKKSFALALSENGAAIDASVKNVATKKYAMTQPLYLVVNDRPTLNVKVVIDFMLSQRGQELVKKCNFFSADELHAAGAN